VKAATDTAVGEIGVNIQIEAEYDGIESEENFEEIEINKAWGYWAMTPELTFGGGYAGSLGNIGYGMDGACTCNYYNTVGFNPGDTSQMRLTYASGPFSAAIALEDATWGDYKYDEELAELSDDALGVAGEIKYSGDMFSGEISGVWRSLNDDDDNFSSYAEDFIGSDWWQVGVGVGFGLGEVASVSLAAAMGEGPATTSADNNVPGGNADGITSLPWNSTWWGVSGIIMGHLTDEIHAEIGAGYKSREFDDFEGDFYDWSADGEEWVIGGGIYYSPVDQLTIGLEASYTETSASVMADDYDITDTDYRVNADSNDTLVSFLSVWRF